MSPNIACGAHKAVRLAPVNSTEKLYQTSELIMTRLVLTQILCKSLTVLSEKRLVCLSFYFFFCPSVGWDLDECLCMHVFTTFLAAISICYTLWHWDIAEDGSVLLNRRFQGRGVLKPVRDSWFSDLFLSWPSLGGILDTCSETRAGVEW